MKKKLVTFLMVFALVLANSSVATADTVRARVKWTGTAPNGGLTISGFSDGNPSTMTFQWTIDENVGNYHQISEYRCTHPAITGDVILKLPIGGEHRLDEQGMVNIAKLLPQNGPVDFPPGVVPKFEQYGSPVAKIVMKEGALDTVLNVTKVIFEGNMLTFEVEEDVQPGSATTAAVLFALEDGLGGGTPNGAISTDFTVDITLTDFDGCAVPIPVMGNKSVLTLALMMLFVGVVFLNRYGDFKKFG